MVLALNAVLYLAALTLALCVVTPLPARASRRVRVARMALALGGGAAMASAITLACVGLWVESAIAGCVALTIVVGCLWVALSQSSAEPDDDGEDSSDGGGGQRRRPVPPAPPEPLGGPDLDWSDFDAARAGWAAERERQPAGV